MHCSFYWLLFLFPIVFLALSPEETLERMSLEEKVGQLFIAPACPLRGEDHWRDWEALLHTCHMGGVLVKKGDLSSHLALLQFLQEASLYPLLVAADYEPGLGRMVAGTQDFPQSRELGRESDLEEIFEVGAEIARQSRAVGVHVNLAPVADVDCNPHSPIIGPRSFGNEPDHVAHCVVAFLQGTQSQDVLACVKHFPGHGDTTVDSHVSLPILLHSRERLDRVELVPFRRAIEAGVASVMIGHLLVPCLDPNTPASLSPTVVSFLRKELGFKGLIWTDALNMKALTASPEEIALATRAAGCDLLVYGSHLPEEVDRLMRSEIPRAYRALVEAYRTESLSEEELNQSVLRILKAKNLVSKYPTNF